MRAAPCILARSSGILILAIAHLTFGACASHAMKKDLNHVISLENVGTEDVANLQLTYGDRRFPRSPHDIGAGSGRGYVMDIPAPEAATVVWTTADGEEHQETVEIRRHIEGKRWFDGEGELSFEVDGPALRVYLVRNLPESFDEERQQIHGPE